MGEHNEVRLEGHDATSAWSLRPTQVFQRERDGWLRLHRHADPLVTRRSLQATLALLGSDGSH